MLGETFVSPHTKARL